MEVIINNKDNLKDDQINEVVKRVKVLLVNSSNEMLLGYSHNTYQFIGGHVEDEEFEDAIVREVKEETGIGINMVRKMFKDPELQVQIYTVPFKVTRQAFNNYISKRHDYLSER